jgi:peptidyl-prolyl cis-trans isomerase B (cyclophilin B)
MVKNIVYVLIAVLLIGGVAWLAYGQLGSQKTEKSYSTQTEAPTRESDDVAKQQTPTTAATSSECKRTYQDSNLKTATMNQTDKYVTLSVEGFGDIKIEVNKTDAPQTSENFIKLAKAGFYDCLTFHRIAKGFVIQGGDPDGTGAGGPGYTIPAEIKLPHLKGSVAMARLGDQMNPSKASSGSQFYIALDALPMLDGEYTVFGQVVSGMDVVAKIGDVPTLTGAQDGPPNQTIQITKAVVSAQ